MRSHPSLTKRSSGGLAEPIPAAFRQATNRTALAPVFFFILDFLFFPLCSRTNWDLHCNETLMVDDVSLPLPFSPSLHYLVFITNVFFSFSSSSQEPWELIMLIFYIVGTAIGFFFSLSFLLYGAGYV